jgi:hypothetical protein
MLKPELFEALRALVARWNERRDDEAVAPRSIPLLVAFKAVFRNIAGFFLDQGPTKFSRKKGIGR